MKKIKIWNGRAQGNHKGEAFVAAYTQKQAAELLGTAFKTLVSTNEIRVYFSPCWGDPMKDIIPTEPCVYHSINWEKPKRIL